MIGARDNADAIKEKQDTVADFDEDISSDVVTPQQIQIKVDQKDAGVLNSNGKSQTSAPPNHPPVVSPEKQIITPSNDPLRYSGDKPTLIYFDAYGRAEQIRILLAHAKVDYTDERVPF